MSENGQHTSTEPKRSFARDLFGLIEDHLELASLEWEFEKAQGARRVIGLVIGLVAALSGFVFLQVAIVYALIQVGIPVWAAAIALAGVYGGIAAACFMKFGKRSTQSGEPFEGTKSEFRKNLQWIERFF